MNTSEMIRLFKLKYDAAGSSAAPDFIDTEVIEFLNNAQLSIVDLLHSQRNFTLLGSLILTTKTIISDGTVLGYKNKYWVKDKSSLPEYRYHIRSISIITKDGITDESLNEYITLDFIDRFLWTRYNKPRFNKCLIFDDDVNRLVIIGDAYTTAITGARITYLKNPTLITVLNTSELDSSLHEKIVEVAVDEAVKSIHRAKVPPQTQTKE